MKVIKGWQLVPTTPTEEMLDAGCDAALGVSDEYLAGDESKNPHKSRWSAMLKVAPIFESDKMSANEKQVAGTHYGSPIQHWDFVVANDLGYFEGQITKYVTRWKKKNGVVDLKKAQHFLEKLIEIEEAKALAEIGEKFRNPAIQKAMDDYKSQVFLCGDPVAMVNMGDPTSSYVDQDRG